MTETTVPTTARRIHDYRQRHWGHDYTLTPDPDPATARIIGWGHGLRRDDFLVIPRPEGGGALYQIEDLRYAADPPDMWFTTSRFVPGTSEVVREVEAAMRRPMIRPAAPFTGFYTGWWEL